MDYFVCTAEHCRWGERLLPFVVERFAELSSHEQLELLSDPTVRRFALVREPIQRVVSAIFDKFLCRTRDKHGYALGVSAQLAKLAPEAAARAAARLGTAPQEPWPCFDEGDFVEMMAEAKENGYLDRVNEHFRPQSSVCKFDNIGYDIISPLESSNESLKELAAALGLNDSFVPLPWNHSDTGQRRAMPMWIKENLTRIYADDVSALPYPPCKPPHHCAEWISQQDHTASGAGDEWSRRWWPRWHSAPPSPSVSIKLPPPSPLTPWPLPPSGLAPSPPWMLPPQSPPPAHPVALEPIMQLGRLGAMASAQLSLSMLLVAGCGRLCKGRQTPSFLRNALGALSLLIVVAVTKTLLTKRVFLHVNLPITFSLLSCLATNVMLVPFFIFKVAHITLPTLRALAGLALVSLAVAIDLACTNVALSMLSVALQQMIRATSPGITLVVERLLDPQSKRRHPYVVAVVLALCVGPMLAKLGSVDSDASTPGILFMLLAVVAGAIKYVVARNFITSSRNELGVLGFTFWVETLIGIMLVPWAIASGEAHELFHGTDHPLGEWVLLWVTAAYGGVRVLAQFYVLLHTTATTLSISNVAIQTLNIVLGIAIFGTQPTPLLVLGAFTTIALTTLYAWLTTSAILDEAQTAQSQRVSQTPDDNVDEELAAELGLDLEATESKKPKSKKKNSYNSLSYYNLS